MLSQVRLRLGQVKAGQIKLGYGSQDRIGKDRLGKVFKIMVLGYWYVGLVGYVKFLLGQIRLDQVRLGKVRLGQAKISLSKIVPIIGKGQARLGYVGQLSKARRIG